ncbi:carbohydrate ABC transporter permease [Pseudonocardia kunmingensis]|uniref:Multiple sugar transport system permease protein/arabinosaccharide transport system permease protein n=1 Tax=Pseudonocardia kunmingensis TaxID=630975 RepID=A0A543DQS3_9PSEU|nr:carbohydrate ABC transporter permease [Pseudonocardia kunmingensis]TQM11668.1 multiple sugar transport system permease protein/arabinosaccharide transport system permease protein [Pseudonocardia kunmingensis]
MSTTSVSVGDLPRAAGPGRHRRRRSRRLTVVVTGLLAVAAISMAAPYVFMMVSAFKPQNEIFATPIRFFPRDLTLDNVAALFDLLPYARWYLNTVVVAVFGTALTLFISSLAGFAFSKYEFRCKNLLFMLVLGTVLIPFQVLLVPQFQIVRELGGFNTYWALILPVAANAFAVFLMRQYTISVPDELLDAARVDGVSEFGLWWRIVVPLVRPGLAVAGTITFLSYWNDFFWPLIVTTDDDMFVVNLGTASLLGPFESQYGILLAGALLASLPLIIMFLFFQRHIIEGLTAGATK